MVRVDSEGRRIEIGHRLVLLHDCHLGQYSWIGDWRIEWESRRTEWVYVGRRAVETSRLKDQRGRRDHRDDGGAGVGVRHPREEILLHHLRRSGEMRR